MASFGQIRQGLDILAKYVDPADKSRIDFQYDIIQSAPNVFDQMTSLEKEQLKTLGWFYDNKTGTGFWAHYT